MEVNNQKRRDFVLTLAKSVGVLGTMVYAPHLAAKDSKALVKSVSMRNGRNQQHIVFELDRSIEHKLFTLSSPNRVVLDLKGAKAAGALKLNSDRPTSLVSRLRYAMRNDDDLRIVLDMAQKTKAKASLSQSSGKYLLEIVLDDNNSTASAAVVAAAAAPAPKQVLKPVASQPKVGSRDFNVAIDPGHGGHDSGAVGKHGTFEKDVVLQIARRLKKHIDNTKGMKAFLTRDSDTFLTLRKRIEIARAKGADLFISVHADANTNKTVTGSSVYILSDKGASSEMAYWLAKSENGDGVEMAGTTLQSDNRVLSEVLLDLTQSAALDDSFDLAKEVLSELGTVNRLARKVVESANFGVLRSPDIPSMLIETAFISNPHEEKQLKTPHYQEKLASAVYRGIRSYKLALEARDPRYATTQSEHQSG
jgi:N-acetylmuramoyl-L-alanine amidase